MHYVLSLVEPLPAFLSISLLELDTQEILNVNYYLFSGIIYERYIARNVYIHDFL